MVLRQKRQIGKAYIKEVRLKNGWQAEEVLIQFFV